MQALLLVSEDIYQEIEKKIFSFSRIKIIKLN